VALVDTEAFGHLGKVHERARGRVGLHGADLPVRLFAALGRD
jgi:hypothetical protein